MTITVKESIENKLEKIKEIDENLMQDVCSVAQSIGQFVDLCEKIDNCLMSREFDKITDKLGYGEMGSAFIFIQRTIGSLQEAGRQKQILIQDIACETLTSYDDVEPQVNEHLESIIPRTPKPTALELIDQQIKKYQIELNSIIEKKVPNEKFPNMENTDELRFKCKLEALTDVKNELTKNERLARQIINEIFGQHISDV